MAPKTIVAVAIGTSRYEQVIRDDADDLSSVRPYIGGLIKGLSNSNQIGRDYEIIYRERKEGDLNGAFTVVSTSDPLIFCMSTTAVKAAQSFTSSSPIVGIVSNPGRENVAQAHNICGISARRSQTGGDCCEHFLKAMQGLREIRALHKRNYNPSLEALDRAKTAAAAYGVTVTPVDVATADDIHSALNSMAARDVQETATVGILVLPADVCFSVAREIISVAQTQKKLPTFFSVTDWVKTDHPSALGGYGVPQERSGELLAERVAHIWQTGNMPTPRFHDVPSGEFRWLASRAAARALNISLSAEVPKV